MYRNDSIFWAWWFACMVFATTRDPGEPIPKLLVISGITIALGELLALIRLAHERPRNRRFYSDPNSQPVPLWWWQKTKPENSERYYAGWSEPEDSERYNQFAGWFEEGVFSAEALRALFDHFIITKKEQHLIGPAAVCKGWGEYTREQFYDKFAGFLDPGDSGGEESFKKIIDLVRLRTTLYELIHEAEPGKINYTYLIREF